MNFRRYSGAAGIDLETNEIEVGQTDQEQSETIRQQWISPGPSEKDRLNSLPLITSETCLEGHSAYDDSPRSFPEIGGHLSICGETGTLCLTPWLLPPAWVAEQRGDIDIRWCSACVQQRMTLNTKPFFGNIANNKCAFAPAILLDEKWFRICPTLTFAAINFAVMGCSNRSAYP